MKKTVYFMLLPFGLFAETMKPITVFSDKLEESVLDNAYSVDVVDKERVELTHSTSLRDLSAMIPTANISGIGNRNDMGITLRGVSNYLVSESSVALYIDDVPVPFSYGFGLVDMNNIQSIEVLKGAQGTLYGKGVESGVINIYTPAPTKAFQGVLSAEYASYNTHNLYALLSGESAISNLNYALSFTKRAHEGYTTNALTSNDADSQEFLSFNTKLNYKPTNTLDITLNYAHSQSDDGTAPYQSIYTQTDSFTLDNEPVDDSLDMQSSMLSLVLKYKQDNSELISVSGLAKQAFKHSDYLDILGGFNVYRDVDIEEFTQELKYKQHFRSGSLLAGAFYNDKFKFDYFEDQTLLNLYAMPVDSLNSVESPDKTKALFAHYRHYFGEKFSLMGGVRYQEITRSFDRVMNNFGAPSTNADDATTWSNLLPTFSLSYYGEDNAHVYFTYSQGYRPGGYAFRTSDLLIPFKEEKTDSYELGYKKILDNNVHFNSALFYNDITDHRTTTLSDTLESITFNADRAYSYGAEFDVRYQKDNLGLYASLGWTKATFKSISEEGYEQYEGKKLLEVPNWTAFVGTKYHLLANFYISAVAKYMGERFYNLENSAKAKAYVLGDFALGYEKEGWFAELYAKNAFDKHYVDFMISTPNSGDFNHFGAPRVVGIKLSKRF